MSQGAEELIFPSSDDGHASTRGHTTTDERIPLPIQATDAEDYEHLGRQWVRTVTATDMMLGNYY